MRTEKENEYNNIDLRCGNSHGRIKVLIAFVALSVLVAVTTYLVYLRF